MNFNTVKGYVLVILSGLVLLAAVLLVVLQWGNMAAFSVYGRNTQINTALLIVFSLIGGPILFFLIWVLYCGVRDLLRGRREQENQKIRHKLTDWEKTQEQS